MRRAFPSIAAVFLLLLPGIAAAVHSPAAGFPWTYSVTGTESADSLGVDSFGNVWVAGLWNRLGSGDDVMLLKYTNAGVLTGTSWYDRDKAGRGEGPPKLKVVVRQVPYAVAWDEIWLAVTTRSSTGNMDGTMVKVKDFNVSVALQNAPGFLEYNENFSFTDSATGIFLGAVEDPFIAGTLESGGVEQSFYVWRQREVSGSETVEWQNMKRVTATYWSGSSAGVRARGLAVDGGNNAWIVAEMGDDVMLLHYSDEIYEEGSTGNWKAPLFPGFPRTFGTPAVDDPRACALDPQGNLWVVGASDGDAVVWKFDWQGNMASGFPRKYVSPGADVFRAIALDEKGRAFAAGTLDTSLGLFGYASNGSSLPGYPVTVSSADVIEVRDMVLDSSGNAWIAATVVSAAGSTLWQGTTAQVYKFDYSPDAAEIAFGSVALRAPLGGILNLAKAETMRIVVYPPSPGDIKVQILTPRGQVVRELLISSTGGAVVSCEWDGKNAAGVPVASGVYAIRVSGGGVSEIKRAAVVRRK